MPYLKLSHVRLQLKGLRKYQTGPKSSVAGDAGTRNHYDEADNEKLYEWLRNLLDWSEPAAKDLELSTDELLRGRKSATGLPVVRGLQEMGADEKAVEAIFRQYPECTRWQVGDPNVCEGSV